VNQPAKPIASHHKQSVRVGSIVIHRWTVRRREVQASVRPMPVVMINEDGEDTFKVTRTQNEQPIGALGTDGPNESFRDRIRLRRLNRRANDTNAGAPKYVVKAAREFVIAIPNQPANRFRALTDGLGHLPCLLRDPLLARMGRAAGEVHPPTADFDEEQHV
jgi:hypothetical protein